MSDQSKSDVRAALAERSSAPEAAGASSPHLDPKQKDQAAAHAAPHALVLHEILREEGEIALAREPSALMWSALAAGLSMGFSLLMEAVLDAGMAPSPWKHLVTSFGYSTGFVLVILGRQQLFTESTLTVVLPLLTRMDSVKLIKALRLWVIVLVCNLLSTWAFASLLLVPDIFAPSVFDSIRSISHEAIASTDFVSTGVRAVFAGWLIALMVWLLPSTGSGRLITVVLVTYVVSAAHLSHIVAGSTEAAYAVLTRDGTFGDYLMNFVLPTLVGNIIGGMSLVALLNHAAIAPEIARSGGD